MNFCAFARRGITRPVRRPVPPGARGRTRKIVRMVISTSRYKRTTESLQNITDVYFNAEAIRSAICFVQALLPSPAPRAGRAWVSFIITTTVNTITITTYDYIIITITHSIIITTTIITTMITTIITTMLNYYY